jgi:uncharacterized membrane protein (UPF0182 family)
MSGFLAVDSDAGNQKGTRREDFGKLRLLQLAKNTSIPAPAQMQNKFSSDPSVSGELNILRNQGSAVTFGNMLTLPLGGSLLYVQPVYVKAKLNSATPFLKKVLVGFGDKVGFSDMLEPALNQVFGTGGTGGSAGGTTPSGTPAPSTGTGTPAPSTGTSSVPSGTAQAELTAALSDAQAALAASDAALKAGDFQSYGAAQARLKAAVARALAAQQRLGASSGAASPPAGSASAAAVSPTG